MNPRVIAWAAFVLGAGASVAANVAHARAETGPRLASAFAPVALLLCVELVAQVSWPQGRAWAWGRWLGTGVVALVAGVTSYLHMRGLLVSYGETPLVATLQPLAVDGLMIVSSVALLALGRSPAVPVAGTVRTDVDELLLVGQAVAGELAARGDRLTRAALIRGLRSRGHPISTTRGSELLKALRDAA